jgi:hypothetical protein
MKPGQASRISVFPFLCFRLYTQRTLTACRLSFLRLSVIAEEIKGIRDARGNPALSRTWPNGLLTMTALANISCSKRHIMVFPSTNLCAMGTTSSEFFTQSFSPGLGSLWHDADVQCPCNATKIRFMDECDAHFNSCRL